MKPPLTETMRLSAGFEGEFADRIKSELQKIIFDCLPDSLLETPIMKYTVVSTHLDNQTIFSRLLHEWRQVQEESSTCSVLADLFICPAYQQIIGMGADALPFIFAELRKEPGFWFWALKSITREDPVPLGHRGKIELMTRDWLDWAEKHGL